MYRTALGICLAAGVLGAWSADGQFHRDDFQRADEATVRRSPGEFPDLPSEVRTALEQRGCTIPQPFDARGEKRSVISGRFTSAGQTDWAVLCSHERRSAILVFHRGRSDHQVDEIAEEPDSQYLQVVSGGREIGYSRQLAVVKPRSIRQRVTRGAHGLPSIDHDGIENIFLGKGSVIWFLSNGKWMRISGDD